MSTSGSAQKVRCIFMLLGLLSLTMFKPLLSQTREAELRAAMIINFVKHTRFPDQDRIKVFKIALWDDDIELINQLRILSATTTINGKPFEVSSFFPTQNNFDVHVIYIGGAFRENIAEIHQKIKNLPILLITNDAPSLLFTMINLRFDASGKKLLFDLNPHNFFEANLSYTPELIQYGGSIIDLKQSYYVIYRQLKEKSEFLLSYQHEVDSLSNDRDSFLKEVNQISESLALYKVNLFRSKLTLDSFQNLLLEKDRLSESLSIEMQRNQLINREMKVLFEQQVASIHENELKLSKLDSQLILRNYELIEKVALFDSLSEVSSQKEIEIKNINAIIEKQHRLIVWVVVFASLLVIALILGGIAFRQRKILNQKLESLVNIRTRELERTMQFFRNLFEKSPVATYQLDLTLLYDRLRQQYIESGKIEVSFNVVSQMTVLDVNKSTLELFGFDHKSDFIINFQQTFSHDSLETIQQSFEALFNNQTEITLRSIRRKKNGEFINVILKWLLITSNDETHKIVLVTLQDITELTKCQNHLEELIQERAEEIIALNKHLIAANEKLRSQKQELERVLTKLQVAQNQLIHHEKMASLGMLSAGIAHEINNPINFISGSYQALQVIVDDLEQQIYECQNRCPKAENSISNLSTIDFGSNLKAIKEMIGNIEAGVERATCIIRSLSAFSHTEENRSVSIDVEKCIQDTLMFFKGNFKSGIELSLDLEKVPPVEGDYISISRVFMNLISNSIDAMEPQGVLIIKTRYYPDQKQVVIQFIDNGHGISKENLPKVFDPFFTTKEVGKGTGLGLYMSYQTVSRYKGEIKIESEIDKGTCVSVVFPVIG